MERATPLEEIVELARSLVQNGANRRGMIGLSPENAAFFTAPPFEIVEPAEWKTESPAAEPAAAFAGEGPTLDAIASARSLAELADLVKTCRKCSLCTTRTQTVFSDGKPTAQVVFVGEAPGEDEDRTGVPFVGKAGQLLTDIIVKGMKMKREDVYICNVLKCRPPRNRDPLPHEKDLCEPYLIRQLELLKPKVICALGRHAANTLLRLDESTGRLRGKWHFYHGIPLRVTYHPAYLLRTPSDKKLAWDDIQHVMRAVSGEEDPFAAAP